jgi:hypothetical protein
VTPAWAGGRASQVENFSGAEAVARRQMNSHLTFLKTSAVDLFASTKQSAVGALQRFLLATLTRSAWR